MGLILLITAVSILVFGGALAGVAALKTVLLALFAPGR